MLRRAGTPYQLSTRELAERTRVTAGVISQRVARAERAGLVACASTRDRSRAVIVSLTPAGHALVESLVDRVLRRETELITGLTRDQRAPLSQLLRVLLDDVQRKVGPYRTPRSDPGSYDGPPLRAAWVFGNQ